MVQTLDPAGIGDKYDRFLSLDIIRQAATYADVGEIQAKDSEPDMTKYAQFANAAVAQTKSANLKKIVFAELSINPNG